LTAKLHHILLLLLLTQPQELPAVFVKRNLGQLVFYDGPEPWKVSN